MNEVYLSFFKNLVCRIKVLTLYLVGNFSCFVTSDDFNQSSFFFEKKECFHEHHQNVKQFASKSGPIICWALSGSELFAKVISR